MADLVTSFSSINDWDLEAIIRGWGGGGGGGGSSAYSIEESPPPAGWSGPDPPQLGLEVEVFDVDQLEATATVLNELEELYKPFLLHHQPMCTDSPTKTTSSSSSVASFHALFDPRIDKGGDAEKLKEQEMKTHSVVDGHTRAKTPCKRRKNKQKTRVVYRGAGDEEDNLAEMDQWNWRKYGQKSIKGSPYPRSYYKCSSVGGCQARKQVEQSKEEPYAYAVTYMGDHSHPLPTRRRSLAGRKLAKFS